MNLLLIGGVALLFVVLLVIVSRSAGAPAAKSAPAAGCSPTLLIVILLLVVAVAVVAGGGLAGGGAIQQMIIGWMGGDRYLDLATLITADQRFEGVQPLDTDGDGEMERVLLYRYDLVSGRSPLGATVLDLNGSRPRGVDNYQLLPIDQNYLSESRFELEVRDIPDVGGTRELLVWGKTPDNIKTDLTIFQWFDLSEPGKQPAPGLRGYANLGSFRGTGGISINGNSVRVLDRAFERSQLAIVHVFLPQGGSYRQAPDGPMRPKVASAIELAFGAPGTVEQTYYPEKAVVAFYLDIGQRTEAAKKLLDPLVVSQYVQDGFGKDVAEPGQLTSMAEVKEIAYTPDAVKERAHGEIAVEVELLNRRPDGSLSDRLHRYRVWVRGFPNPKAAPYGAEWRIIKFEPLS